MVRASGAQPGYRGFTGFTGITGSLGHPPAEIPSFIPMAEPRRRVPAWGPSLTDICEGQTDMTDNLWPHQRAAVNSALEAIQNGRTSGLWVLPTGTGKTRAFVALAAELGGQTLVVVHRDELLRQAVETSQQQWPEAAVAPLGAPGWEGARVVVATVQSLQRKLDAVPADRFGLVVLDEAHHAPPARGGRSLTTSARDSCSVARRPPTGWTGRIWTRSSEDSRCTSMPSTRRRGGGGLRRQGRSRSGRSGADSASEVPAHGESGTAGPLGDGRGNPLAEGACSGPPGRPAHTPSQE